MYRAVAWGGAVYNELEVMLQEASVIWRPLPAAVWRNWA